MTRQLLLLASASLLIACSQPDPADSLPEGAGDVVTEPSGSGAPDLLAAITPESVTLDENDPILPYIRANGPQAMALSPDGQMIAYRSDASGARQLYTMPSGGGRKTQQTDGSGITFFRWTPDSSAIIYGADTDGDEQEAFWRLDVESGESTRILDAVKGGFRAFGAFSGDGSVFAYTSTERNGRDYDLYIYDMATGESRLVSEGKLGQFVQAVSEDGSRIAVTTTVGEDSDNLYVVDAATGERTTISEPEPRANHTDGGMIFADDGNLLLTTNRGSEFRKIIAQWTEPGPDGLFGEFALWEGQGDAEQLNLCGRRGDTLVFTENVDGRSVLHASRRGTPVAVPNLGIGVSSVSCHPGSDRVAVLTRSPKSAGLIRIFELGSTDMLTVVAPDMAGLNRRELVIPTSLTITARDGVDLQGLLYVPRGIDNPPVVFNVHGGPTGQSRPDWDPTVQYLVSRGIAVFEPNVRGSTGFGRTYVTLDDQRRRLDSVRDLIDMLESPVLSGRVDTSRAAVRGGSYGGYMVNAVLGEYPDAFDAGVSLFGVGDWVTALEVASPALKASDLVEYGDITDPEWRSFYEGISPVRLANQIRVPVLYSHGEMDPRIDIAETEVMVKALRENGVEAEFVRIPDEGHGWRKLENRQFYYPIEADFLLEHLGVE